MLVNLGAARGESYTITTISGLAGNGTQLGDTGDGTNSGARFVFPAGACLDAASNLYVLDGHALRRIAPSGSNWVATTLAGVVGINGMADGTNAGASFNKPQAIAVDSGGTLYIADTLNNAIRKVTPIGPDWVVTTLAGLPGPVNFGSADGTNTAARFKHPYGIARDNAGSLYVADTDNHTIRKITQFGSDWVVTTLAGVVGISGIADGSNNVARFNAPSGVAIQNGTNLFIADYNNNSIRKLNPSGTNWVVTTVAGLTGTRGVADGTNTNARFYLPQALALDGAGNFFVTDSGNNTIRKMKPVGANWVVSTPAGLAGAVGSNDGTGSWARFSDPYGLAVDNLGRVFIADYLNRTIRLGQLAMLMNVSFSSSQLKLSWPAAASNFVLEASSSISATGSWPSVTSGIVLSGDTYNLTTNMTAPAAFFRLHKP